MSYGRKSNKTEHAGAKNGGGYWGKREDAKRASRKNRRQDDRQVARNDYAQHSTSKRSS